MPAGKMRKFRPRKKKTLTQKVDKVQRQVNAISRNQEKKFFDKAPASITPGTTGAIMWLSGVAKSTDNQTASLRDGVQITLSELNFYCRAVGAAASVQDVMRIIIFYSS